MTRTVRDAAIMLGAMAGHDPKDSTSAPLPVPDFEAALDRRYRGLRIGIPREYRVDGMPAEIEALWQAGIAWLQDAGAETGRDSACRITKYALPAYYIIAPAEARPTSRAMTACASACASTATASTTMYEKTRAAGFGAEVRRRILIGTYVLSAGYYDAYYLKAQQVRALIARDFDAGLRALRRDPDADRAVAPPSRIGEKMRRSARDVPERRVHRAVDLAGGLPGDLGAGGAVADGLPLGLQVIGRAVRRGDGVRGRGGAGEARRPSPRCQPSWREGGMSLIEGRTGAWEIVIGLEVHAQVVSQGEAVLRRARPRSAPSPTRRSRPSMPAFPGMLPVINGHCVEQAVQTGLGLDAADQPASRCSTARIISIADLPAGYQISQYHAADRRQGRDRARPAGRLDARRSASRGCISSRMPARACTTSIRRKTYVDLNRAGVGADGDRVRARHAQRRGGRRLSCASCARSCAISAPATATWRKAAALRLQRVGAQAGRAARHALRDQERQLDPLRHAGDRVRGAPPDRGDRRRRHDRAGDAAVRRRARRDAPDALARKRRTTTAISPIPTCCRWCSTRHGSSRCAPACRNCRTRKKARFIARLRPVALRRRRAGGRAARPPILSRRWPRAATPSSPPTG